MSKEQGIVLAPEEKKVFEEAGLSLYTFPPLNLGEVTLPHLDAEISWLRRHVEEGSVNAGSLTLMERTVFMDMQPCPRFLVPYHDDKKLLGPILSEARNEGNIPRDLLWGSDVGIKLPVNSRWGVSYDEIVSIVIPQAKVALKTDKKVRLPSVAELLYLVSRDQVFNVNLADHSLATKEWAGDPFFSANDMSSAIGNLTVSGSVEKFANRGVSWWVCQGDFNRLPTLGFRLVVEVE